mmetsp:Transcript_30393/g.96984  ORF Transcript_30393/g.96984 Transcript_30393/m.96984 type:complete len:306 (+) Transcript_30393:759-1676(+)
MRQRRLEERRREGVVHDEQGADLLGRRRRGRDARDLERRVRGRLEPEQLRARRRAGLGERPRVVEVHEGKLHAVGGHGGAAEVALRAAVDVVDADDVVARLEQVQDRRRGRHARGEGAAVAPALGRRHGPLVGAARGVARAAVLPAVAEGRRHVLALLVAGLGLRERCREADGDHHRAGLRVRLLPSVDHRCAEAVLRARRRRVRHARHAARQGCLAVGAVLGSGAGGAGAVALGGSGAGAGALGGGGGAAGGGGHVHQRHVRQRRHRAAHGARQEDRLGLVVHGRAGRRVAAAEGGGGGGGWPG